MNTAHVRDPKPEHPAREPEIVRAVILPSVAEINAARIDPRLVARFVLRYWLFLGIAAVLGGAGAVGLSYVFTPVYRAEVLVAPVTSDEDSFGFGSLLSRYGGLASAVGIDIGQSSDSTTQALALLRSRQFIEQFIVDKSLMPVLFPDRFKGDAPDPDERPPTLQDGYNRFVRKIMLVKQDKTSNLVTLRIDWHDPVVAASWANELIDRINAATREDAIRESERSLEYLRSEFQKADYVTLRESISSVMEAQVNKRMLAQTRPDYSFRIIDPAKPPDPDKYASPRRVLFAAVGFMLGGLIGICLCLFYSRRREARLAERPAG